MITLPEVETVQGTWAVRDVRLVVRRLLDAAGDPGLRPVLVAVDGRSGSGKSTIAGRIAALVPGSVVVHTDDVAWEESFFDWDALMAAHVLAPAREGAAVTYRPPAWDRLGRSGAIEVPAGSTLVLVEGVGAGRASLADHYDATVWVLSDEDERRRRGVERDVVLGRTPDEAADFWDRWQSEEYPFLADDRPWERATVVSCGTPGLTGLAPSDEDVVVLTSRT
ncbi:uridine kinase family protein [Longivirga aurantiaca]|uniref:Uridine kinase n=1 Tax=Longivirga aurantiaca TaxID=1837743 RepID=A0ABW1T5U5_9ACTN